MARICSCCCVHPVETRVHPLGQAVAQRSLGFPKWLTVGVAAAFYTLRLGQARWYQVSSFAHACVALLKCVRCAPVRAWLSCREVWAATT